jgi:hypothetical protein
MTLPWTDLITQIGAAVRQVLPNPEAQREFDLKIMELAAKAEENETQLALGQIGINKAEATHANLFVAGWRPFIGWTGGVALGYTWIVAPLLQFAFRLFGNDVPLPALDPDAIWPIIAAMLGLGTMRSFEKSRGVATSVNGAVLAPRRAALPADLEGLV